MSDSKFKKAFKGAAGEIQKDLGRNLFAAGFTTAVMAAFSFVALPAAPLFAAGYFVGTSLYSGGKGAYNGLKRSNP